MELKRIIPNRCETVLNPTEMHSQDVLEVLTSESRILFKDDNFLVIDKPHDVRMNGNFSVTVEKLVLRSFPCLSVNDLKWVHQLDYATSGVLCIGLNREAAAIASLAFEKRETRKAYLAVLDGYLDITKFPRAEALNANICNDEDITAIGPSSPSASVSAPSSSSKVESSTGSWQDASMKAMLSACLSQLVDLGEREPSAKQEPQWIQFSNISFDQFAISSKLRKQLRKYLKVKGVLIEEQSVEVQRVTVAEADPASCTGRGVVHENVTINRRINCGQQPIDSGRVLLDSDSNRLLISFPIAEISDDFRMEIGHSVNPGKPSITALEVLGHATYMGRPVTKVKLYPKSGRRHQLRLHCAALGFPIVGDYTYNISAAVALDHKAAQDIYFSVKRKFEDELEISERKEERMMLHAYSLRIPVSKHYQPTSKSKETFRNMFDRAKLDCDGVSIVDIISTDPFILDDEKLAI